MKRNIGFFLFLVLTSGFSSDRIQEFFEWGEYDSLLIETERYFLVSANVTDSLTCRNYAYRAVALFVKGNIAESRRIFMKAQRCSQEVQLNPQYVTAEILSLFRDAQTEVFEQKREAERNDSLSREHADSLQIAQGKMRDLSEEKIQEAARLQSRMYWNAGAAALFFTVCGTFSALAYDEYRAGLKTDRLFREAASVGDRLTYDVLKSDIKKVNRVIAGYSALSGLSGIVSCWLGFRSFQARRVRIRVLGGSTISEIHVSFGF